MNNVATVENLKMQYENKTAVDGISFEVREGEVLGLLGPNGAGKSTTIHILSGVLSASSGNVSILGHSVKKGSKEMKKGIGIVPQDIAIYEEISAEKNVRFFASLYSLKGEELKARVKEALELVQLYDRKDDKPKTFSGGMKRRLNIACAIAHQPKLIIMDEPTVGIDPQSRHHILESIKELKTKGASIIYSTHYMEEVEAISDRIMIMNEGRIIANGTKEGFEELQNILYSRQNFRKRQIESAHIFQMKLVCPQCGNRLGCERSVYFRKKDQKNVESLHYRCQSCALNERPSISVSEKKLEKALLLFMKNVKFDLEPVVKEEKNETTEIQNAIVKIERQREKFQKAWASDLMTDEEFTARMSETRKAHENFTKRLSEIQRATPLPIDIKKAKKLVNEFKINWAYLNTEEKREFVQSFIEKIEFTKKDQNPHILNVSFY